MIERFLIALLLAAIASGMFQPLYRRLVRRFGGRESLASVPTLVVVLCAVIGPAVLFCGMVAAQAVELSGVVGPWIQAQLGSAGELNRLFDRFPALAPLAEYRDQVLPKVGEIAGGVGGFAVGALADLAQQTATFFFLLFVMLYAMFFFLIDGKKTLDKILYYLPLPPEDEARMVERFLSVTRATLKGTLVIGIAQGLLGGIAFWAVGIRGAAFWATVMAVLSAVPGVGTALVWVPAVGYLAAVDRWPAAIGLLAWCAIVVAGFDSFMRPRLVGKDTKMPDLMILLSTLGGIMLFGALGLVIGPIIAALFITVWELYGEAFRGVLPEAKANTQSAPIADDGGSSPGG
jgi:predicted PurR-regulated permease PerM